MLTEQQIERYSRQIILPHVGGRGQEKLLSAAVAIVGNGHLAATVGTYIAAAGVGSLAISAPAVEETTKGLNPDCHLRVLPKPLTDTVAHHTARCCDVMLACGVAAQLCRRLNVACVAERTPLVWADTAGPIGLVAVLTGDRPESPCFACVELQVLRLLADGDASHVLAEATAAFVGTLQATEAIKMLIGLQARPTGWLLAYDAVAGTVNEVGVAKDPSCGVCGASRP